MINLPQIFQGRITGRTECSINAATGNFSCLSGDCGSGELNCNGNFSKSPATLIEFSIGIGSGNHGSYDVSLLNGYNLPVSMAPKGGTGSRCATTGCVFNFNDGCPDEFRVVKNDGTIIGCRSPCDVFKTPESCCTTGLSDCQRNNFSLGSLIFKKTCPRAYSYPLDDATSTFLCSGSRVSYTVTFCPPPSLASLVSQPLQGIGSPSPSPSQSPRPLIFLAPIQKNFTGSPSNSNSKRKRRISLIVGLTTSTAISILMLYGVWICVRKKKVVKASSCKYSESVISLLKLRFNSIS